MVIDDWMISLGVPYSPQQGVAAKLDNVTNQIVVVNEVKADKRCV